MRRLHVVMAMSVLVGATSVGCMGGEDSSPASIDEMRPCLERGRTDLLADPPAGDSSGGVVLARLGSISSGFVRPPAGSVGLVAFFETEDAASQALETVKASPAEPLTPFAPGKVELHGRAVVLWLLPVRDSDRSLVEACVESMESTGDSVLEPAQPLGCVQLFLASEATLADVRRTKGSLLREPLVDEVEFVSKQRALALVRRRFPELTENLEGNPLPHSFRVGPTRGRDALPLAEEVERYPRVEHVTTSSLPCSLVQPRLVP